MGAGMDVRMVPNWEFGLDGKHIESAFGQTIEQANSGWDRHRRSPTTGCGREPYRSLFRSSGLPIRFFGIDNVRANLVESRRCSNTNRKRAGAVEQRCILCNQNRTCKKLCNLRGSRDMVEPADQKTHRTGMDSDRFFHHPDRGIHTASPTQLGDWRSSSWFPIFLGWRPPSPPWRQQRILVELQLVSHESDSVWIMLPLFSICLDHIRIGQDVPNPSHGTIVTEH